MGLDLEIKIRIWVQKHLGQNKSIIFGAGCYAKSFSRRSVLCLIVGLKCGGSDGLSRITANLLIGSFSDRLIAYDSADGGPGDVRRRNGVDESLKRIVKLVNGFGER